ncbi:hypothetical protein N0V90_009803 [Kalmusia sp. IMI 367209]|nr:hypothetical protein N0V90_009803 [Kalmusia sp. IMI 367209]
MFEYAYNTTTIHLIPQPSDLALNPPESYLLIQDFLIISCGVLYALCYMFYMTRTFSDRYCAGTPLYLSLTMAYELYYAIVMTSSKFEFASFLVWFLMDASLASIAIWKAYAREKRGRMVQQLAGGVLVGIGVLRVLGAVWPDEREQVTAYWTGLVLQVPISWGSLILLLQRGDTKGQSLEIWITRYLGCYTAYGVFVWRYLNAPQNWAYVGSWWSWGIILITLLPETVYPFVYVWAYGQEKGKVKNA